jgi:hypothetical protein
MYPSIRTVQNRADACISVLPMLQCGDMVFYYVYKLCYPKHTNNVFKRRAIFRTLTPYNILILLYAVSVLNNFKICHSVSHAVTTVNNGMLHLFSKPLSRHLSQR